MLLRRLHRMRVLKFVDEDLDFKQRCAYPVSHRPVMSVSPA